MLAGSCFPAGIRSTLVSAVNAKVSGIATTDGRAKAPSNLFLENYFAQQEWDTLFNTTMGVRTKLDLVACRMLALRLLNPSEMTKLHA
eukprot:5123109-Pyramimonas_sp.AAC.1